MRQLSPHGLYHRFVVGLAENGAAGHEGVGRLQLERRFPLRSTQEAYWTRHGYLSKSHLTIEKKPGLERPGLCPSTPDGIGQPFLTVAARPDSGQGHRRIQRVPRLDAGAILRHPLVAETVIDPANRLWQPHGHAREVTQSIFFVLNLHALGAVLTRQGRAD